MLDDRVTLFLHLANVLRHALALRAMGEIGILDRSPAHVIVQDQKHFVRGFARDTAFHPNGIPAEHRLDFAECRLRRTRDHQSDELRHRQRSLVISLDDKIGCGIEFARDCDCFSIIRQAPARDIVCKIEMRRRVLEALAEGKRFLAQPLLVLGDPAFQVGPCLLQPGIGEEFDMVRQCDHGCPRPLQSGRRADNATRAGTLTATPPFRGGAKKLRPAPAARNVNLVWHPARRTVRATRASGPCPSRFWANPLRSCERPLES